MFVNDHHGDGNVGVWCAAAQGTQTALKAAPPDWFFIPPYVGYRGWIGIRMDRGIADDEFAEFMLEAYATIAPPKLVELLNAK